MLVFGDCKIGEDWAKQILPDVSASTMVSQSLYFPIFLRSSARVFVIEKKIKNKDNNKVFLIMGMGLGIFFEYY